jgi:hypothetical protein
MPDAFPRRAKPAVWITQCKARPITLQYHPAPPSWRLTCQDLLNLRELPLLVAQRARRARLEPALDAVQVEHVPAAAPGDAQPGMVGVAWWVYARGSRRHSTVQQQASTE